MIEIKVDNETVIRALNELAAAGDNLEPVLSQIGEQLVESTKKRFLAGEAPDGTEWAPNSSVTVKRKGRNQPLIGETRSLSNQIFSDSSSSSVEVGSSMEYAAVQQFGAKKGQFTKPGKRTTPWGHIPARPFLGISTQDEIDILGAIEEHLVGDID